MLAFDASIARAGGTHFEVKNALPGLPSLKTSSALHLVGIPYFVSAMLHF